MPKDCNLRHLVFNVCAALANSHMPFEYFVNKFKDRKKDPRSYFVPNVLQGLILKNEYRAYKIKRESLYGVFYTV